MNMMKKKACWIISLILSTLVVLSAKADDSNYIKYSFCYFGDNRTELSDYLLISESPTLVMLGDDIIKLFMRNGTGEYPVLDSNYNEKENTLTVEAVSTSGAKVLFLFAEYGMTMIISKNEIFFFTDIPVEVIRNL